MTEKLSSEETERIRANVEAVRTRIAAAARRAGRDPAEVTLVAVTKKHPAGAAVAALDAGVRVLGENRVQELLNKQPDVGSGAEFHLIGHLQTNKVRQVIDRVAMIQSVDSLHLAQEIDRQAGNRGKRMDVLIEVNIGAEASKSGVAPDEAAALAGQVAGLGHLRLRGLMAVPPVCETPEQARPYFRRMRKLFVDIKDKKTDNMNISGLNTLSVFDTLSMGMSADFEIAVEEGATMVRVGTTIFGSRAVPGSPA